MEHEGRQGCPVRGAGRDHCVVYPERELARGEIRVDLLLDGVVFPIERGAGESSPHSMW